MDRLLAAGDAAVAGVLLAAAAVALAVQTWRTARPPHGPLPDLGQFFTRWRDAHGGYDPVTGSVWVRAWLISVYRLARPLARAGVRPNLLTVWTLVIGAGVVVAASAGGAWAALAGWLVVFGGLSDSLDGAVAALADRATRWGYVLDSAVDRCNDVLFAGALVVIGAPLWPAVLYVVLFFQLEYIRARAGNAGAGDVVVITVGERANRVAFCAAALFVAGLFPARAALVATIALAVLITLSAVGVAQLLVAVQRGLGGSGRTDEVGDDRRRQGDQRHPAAGM